MDIKEQPIVSVFLPMCDAVMSSYLEGRILLEYSFDIAGRIIGIKAKVSHTTQPRVGQIFLPKLA